MVNKNRSLGITPKIELIISDTISFPLDSITAGRPRSLQYYNGKFEFLNRYANTIYIYDYKTRNLVKKIEYAKEGGNGVGKITGFVVHCPDSIYVNSYVNKKIYLTNSKGLVLKSYELTNQNKIKYPPSPKGWTNTPMIIISNNLFFGGSIAGEYTDETKKNRPVMTKIDLETNKIKYLYHYPDIYSQANWGGALFRWITYDYLPLKKEFVFSFHASHKVQVASINFLDVEEYYAGSQLFGDIASLGLSKQTFSKPERRKHFAVNPSYGTIVYDKHRKLYYRMAFLPVKNYKFGKNDLKKLSIIVLDNNFNWLCEKTIPRYSHSWIQYFVNEKGLHLKKYNTTEDYITFSVFTPKPI